MRLLLDTNIILWLAMDSARLNVSTRRLLGEPGVLLCYSVASLWEIAIKAQLRRDDFVVDPRRLRRTMLDADFLEWEILAEHVLAIGDLPLLHRDPFDRLLLAQARHEGATFVTADHALASYPVSLHLA
jgi:PIN domain nuclease of toxin-antitoxin system